MGEGTMDIDYLDLEAKHVATTPGPRPSGWTEAEVSRLRLIVQCVRSAIDVSDVLNLRTLRLRLEDGLDGYVTALGPLRLLRLAFKEASTPITAVLDIARTRTDPET
jgi:hypothetical protein